MPFVEPLPLLDVLDAARADSPREPSVQAKRRQHVQEVLAAALEPESTHQQYELDDDWREEPQHEPTGRVNRSQRPVDLEDSVFAALPMVVEVQIMQVGESRRGDSLDA